jgi:ubiquinone/menaquinone biosynthesis C-methylase UbiE
VGGELPRLPFRDGSFPQVVLSDVVSSLAPEMPYLAELRRVLSDRGTLVLATGRSKRSEAEWKRELERHGFSVDEVRRIAGAELVVRAVIRGEPSARAEGERSETRSESEPSEERGEH